MMKSPKEALREKILRERGELSAREAAARSALAQERLLAEPSWSTASKVALFVSAKGEIDTSRLLQAAWASRKEVLLPRVDRNERGLLRFALCSGARELAPGTFGIPEPRPDLCPDYDFGSAGPPELFILPGLAFDRRGRRLGWGAGYYDRFLAQCSGRSALVGFAYDFQLLPEIPAESWDYPVEAVCTDKEMLWIG